MRYMSFNSLQTGKGISRFKELKAAAEAKDKVFQFPSNGKGYLKKKIAGLEVTILTPKVSIPFKRERVSQADYVGSDGGICWEKVSIPFKRERVSQVISLRIPA